MPLVVHAEFIVLMKMRAAHDLGVRDGHLDNRLRVLRADLLKEGQLQTAEYPRMKLAFIV